MSNQLLIMRHAKSSWDDRSLRDHDRPLNDRGRRDAPRMAEWLNEQGLAPDIILTSSANRAQTTATLIVEHLKGVVDVEIVEEFYLAAPATYLEVLANLPDNISRPMVVGHNPGLEDLVQTLGGDDEVMPTAAIAYFENIGENWKRIADQLGNYPLHSVWRPKEI